ncbi:uncharacterized protein EI97DRAFT_460683 [Westerdykella ornata]|uniref:Uncharacterized protein n=1 Tax=Westerdykella ornata TaxID=318751 RepID=A0A6A6JBE1_WESOR|nr:uncharacterized protein EI97DRAFT_460683 [Westerdykella ornata]KAF2273742.1 hypothetical protein EI97DRAFT_460683 [Westerdykella ornata]
MAVTRVAPTWSNPLYKTIVGDDSLLSYIKAVDGVSYFLNLQLTWKRTLQKRQIQPLREKCALYPFEYKSQTSSPTTLNMDMPDISTLSMEVQEVSDSASSHIKVPCLPTSRTKCSIFMGKQEYALSHPEEHEDPWVSPGSPEKHLYSLYHKLRGESCGIKLKVFGKKKTLCQATQAEFWFAQIAGMMRHNLRMIANYKLDASDIERPYYPIHSQEDTLTTTDTLSAEDEEALHLMNVMDGCAARHIGIHEEWISTSRPFQYPGMNLSEAHRTLLNALNAVSFRISRNTFAHAYGAPSGGISISMGSIFENLASEYEKALRLIGEVLAELKKAMTGALVKAETGLEEDEDTDDEEANEEVQYEAFPDDQKYLPYEDAEDSEVDEDLLYEDAEEGEEDV